MDSDRKISPAVINRLPRYYRYLGDLLESDITRISSKELSAKMNITASQIRQDLNHFGGFGQQGYGYNVAYLHDEIGKILGLDKKHIEAGVQPDFPVDITDADIASNHDSILEKAIEELSK